MAGVLIGRSEQELKRDKEGHREYTLVSKVSTTASGDGPAIVLATPGLPAIGATWSFGNDSDSWAFCWPDMTITPMVTEEPSYYWTVEQKFSTKPLDRCQDATIENPLNEPDEISGSFQSFRKEAIFDKDGDPFLSSSLEPLTGPALERDFNKAAVTVKMNISALPLSAYTAAMNTVNDATLWGLAARKIKLSNVQWNRKLYGTCTYYYQITYLFDIDFSGHDTTVLDEGTRVLCPGGTPTNPKHFEAYKNPTDGENAKVLLDGSGGALDDSTSPVSIAVQFYNESNFLLLGIPATL